MISPFSINKGAYQTAWMCQAMPYTMVCPPARQTIPCSIPCNIGHTKYHMRCPPGLTIYHAMPIIPYRIPCHARQVMPYTMPCPPGHPYTMPCIVRPCHIPCYTSLDHTLYQVMPARLYLMPCHAHQAIPYTMPCPPGYTIYHAMHRQPIPYTMPYPPGHIFSHAMPARSYHIPCHAHQTIPHAMPCPPGHTIYHVMPARTYHIPCHTSPGHNIYHAMPTRPYHIPYHARHVISYTMPCTANDCFG